MSKIIGNTTATPVPRSDWNQTDKKRPDFIRNKPALGAIAEKDAVDKNDLALDVQSSLEQIDTKANIVTMTTAEFNAIPEEEINANTLYMLTDTEEGYGSSIPTVTVDDNGKFLRVVNGTWEAATVPNAEEATF